MSIMGPGWSRLSLGPSKSSSWWGQWLEDWVQNAAHRHSPNPPPISPRRAVGLRTTHRTAEPARVPGCGTLGFLEVLRAPVPLPSAWPGAGPGPPAGEEKTLGSGWGWESGLCHPPAVGSMESKEITNGTEKSLTRHLRLWMEGSRGKGASGEPACNPSSSHTAEPSPTSGPGTVWGRRLSWETLCPGAP